MDEFLSNGGINSDPHFFVPDLTITFHPLKLLPHDHKMTSVHSDFNFKKKEEKKKEFKSLLFGRLSLCIQK